MLWLIVIRKTWFQLLLRPIAVIDEMTLLSPLKKYSRWKQRECSSLLLNNTTWGISERCGAEDEIRTRDSGADWQAINEPLQEWISHGRQSLRS